MAIACRLVSHHHRNRHEVEHTHAIVVGLLIIANKRSDLRHGFDTHDTLDRKVGLIRETAGKVVRAEL